MNFENIRLDTKGHTGDDYIKWPIGKSTEPEGKLVVARGQGVFRGR
jgi:hypothetical protein